MSNPCLPIGVPTPWEMLSWDRGTNLNGVGMVWQVHCWTYPASLYRDIRDLFGCHAREYVKNSECWTRSTDLTGFHRGKPVHKGCTRVGGGVSWTIIYNYIGVFAKSRVHISGWMITNSLRHRWNDGECTGKLFQKGSISDWWIVVIYQDISRLYQIVIF